MTNIRFFLSKNFHFLVVKFSVYLNRHVFIMSLICAEKTSSTCMYLTTGDTLLANFTTVGLLITQVKVKTDVTP